ncbi:MAG: hypothetical protein ABGW77_00310 [Campylobacterales bacterium]
MNWFQKIGGVGVLATALFGCWGYPGPCWGGGPGWGYWDGATPPQLTKGEQGYLTQVYQRLLLTNQLYSELANRYPNTPFPNLRFWTFRQLGWVRSWISNPPTSAPKLPPIPADLTKEIQLAEKVENQNLKIFQQIANRDKNLYPLLIPLINSCYRRLAILEGY